MDFKKQAFKIKDLLKEKGIELPLVSIQEILSKSYGFNNRHVALESSELQSFLSKIHSPKKENDVQKKVLRGSNLPDTFSEETLKTISFLWSDGFSQDSIIKSTNNESPFNQNINQKKIIYIHEPDFKTKKPIILKSYIYNSNSKAFVLCNIIFSFLTQRNKKLIYKNFNEMDLTSDEISFLIENSTDWKSDLKRIIQHKDAKVHHILPFTKSDKFYIRFTAFFSKYNRKEIAPLAKNDPDPRIRRAYYLFLLKENNAVDDVRSLLKNDPTVLNLLKYVTIDDVPLINWR